MNPILLQAIYYFVVMLLTIFVVEMIQKGLFLKYFIVKLSFGRKILVKIRAINRDYFKVGKIEDGFLLFKGPDNAYKRIAINDKEAFYRVIGTTWIDVDEEKNAITKTDYSTIPGFDASKFQNLFLRTLYKPTIADPKEKIIIGMLVIIILGLILIVYFQFQLSETLTRVISLLNEVNSKATIIGG